MPLISQSKSTSAAEYAARLARHESRFVDLTRREERIASARLFVGFVTVAVIAAGVFFKGPSAWWALPLAAVFIWLVIWHSAIRRLRARTGRAAIFYRRAIDRLNDQWTGQGSAGERYLDENHVYAADLDLFGPGSLFELLSTARTRMGEETLARWLLAPADIGEIRERQSGIGDLRERLDLREELAIAGEPGIGVKPDALLEWAESTNQFRSHWIRVAAIALPAVALLTAIVWAALDVRWPFLVTIIAGIAVLYSLKNRISAFTGATRSFENLDLLTQLLTRIEREQFGTPTLQALQRQLVSHSRSASRAFGRLRAITDFAAQRDNILVRVLFEVPLLYSVNLALAAESWRAAHGANVRSWINAAGRFEALSSLALYAYERPENVFPEVVEGSPEFEARGLGHPLLPATSCVRNDVAILAPVRTLLVSGSNMSGKSTLLRAIGVNAVLAMAGAPVRAYALRMTAVRIGASIRVNDSLAKGQSRFYAEITRLRDLYELSAQSPPLLFLLDELLQGTNSSDRRVGAEGVLRALIERGAIGLISTHDLALTDISSVKADSLRNVHFQDFFEGGRMNFDFRLREGIVTKSNGIELMRSIGLDV